MKPKVLSPVALFLLVAYAAQCADDGSEDYDKALGYLQSDEIGMSLEYVNQAIEKDPTSATYLALRGDILQRDGKYNDAIDSYDKALNLDCSCLDVRQKKCKLLYDMKKIDQALTCCRANLNIDPTYKDSINLLNIVELKKAERSGKPIKGYRFGFNDSVYQGIMDSYDMAIEIDKNYTSAWNNKGVFLGKLEMYNESIACFDEVIGINSSNSSLAAAWNNRGVSLSLSERHEEALECYDRAIELDPQMAEALHNKCITLRIVLPLNTTNYLKSKSYCDRANEINPELEGEFVVLVYKEIV